MWGLAVGTAFFMLSAHLQQSKQCTGYKRGGIRSFSEAVAYRDIPYLIVTAIWFKLILSFSIEREGDYGLLSSLYAATDGVIFFALVASWFVKPMSNNAKSVVYAVGALFFLNFITWTVSDVSFVDQSRIFLKTILPILCLLLFIDLAKNKPYRYIFIVKGTGLVVLACTMYGFMFFDPEYNRLEQWQPAYFSGLHTTAYVWVAMCFLVILLQKKITTMVAVWVISMIAIGEVWGVRTAQAAILLYGIFTLYDHVPSKYLKTSAKILPIIGILLGAAYLYVSPSMQDLLDQFMSGRISMYGEKINQLYNSSVTAVLFGGGAGSDLITTDIWWWAKKGSHNDYFTIFVEQGVVYIGVFVIVLSFLVKLVAIKQQKNILLVYMVISLFSNGIMVRPLAAYILFLVIGAYVALDAMNDKRITVG